MKRIGDRGVIPRRYLFYLNSLLIAGVVLMSAPGALPAATIVAYVEGPAMQSSSVAGVVTETFDGFSTGRYTSSLATNIGTYQATSSAVFSINSADLYGGAGGTGNYFAVGAESGSEGPIVVNLKSEANYFGFWWPAGDSKNSITFMQNGVALASFTTSNIVTLLPKTTGATVTAINGTKYNTVDYYGNPNPNISPKDDGEPFAYVDVIANGLTFNQVAFSNATLDSGFESDNHSVANGITDPPAGDVIVQNVPLAAPEPGSLLLVVLGFTFVIVSRLLRISRTS